MQRQNIEKLLIAAVTPSFLEKGVFEYSKQIEKQRAQNSWFRRNTLIIEKDQQIQLSHFLRQLAELGYSKVWETTHRGEFSQRGGTTYIFPINTEKIYTIEFEGNKISLIIQTFVSKNSLSLPRPAVGARAHTPNFYPQKFGFQAGDYVVHIDHGIGIFSAKSGSASGGKNETESECIIEYAAGDTLSVPKEIAEKRLAPYLGIKTPRISRLGTPLWSLTKKKAKEDIVAFAKELLEVFAQRKIATRSPYHAHPEEEDLATQFLHHDTPDQTKAMQEIFSDLEKEEPMERILVGDVGFGKTELALRTAFRVILNGKQIALVAPTTILADQHYEVFKKRLEHFGVVVARFTRLETPSDIKKTKQRLAAGYIDMVIGTHKLLGKDVALKHLGLLIVDEEQKFGVAHKEHFKKQHPTLDTLTLSATPIPRTLNMALSGLHAISRIETPPRGRQQIKTYVLPKNKKIMRDAIRYELSRGGQIYFLAARIHSMPRILEEIKKLKTGARIGMLHGRMSEKEIIQTMHDFKNKKIDLLLSTTIIENGLDISNANTLIVENATLLGLAEAHQLRGRVGRANKDAFAYFLYPTQKLKERAAERLEALERYGWLGAGMDIATRDLELRGAGNILGRAQSGVAYRVGLNLYFQLLEEAITELKKQ